MKKADGLPMMPPKWFWTRTLAMTWLIMLGSACIGWTVQRFLGWPGVAGEFAGIALWVAWELRRNTAMTRQHNANSVKQLETLEALMMARRQEPPDRRPFVAGEKQ